MKGPLGVGLVTMSLCLMCAAAFGAENQSDQSAPPTPAQLARRIDELEQELAQVKAQLAQTLQAGERPAANSTATPAPTSAAAVTPSTAASQPASAAGPPPASGPLEQFFASTDISASVDAYYGYNFNQPADRTTPFRAFAGPNNQFGLNMVELTLSKPPEANNSRLGYDLSFGFGNAIDAMNSAEPGGLGFAQYLKEAYFSYLAPVGKGLQVDVGKFVTPAGAEVIETQGNWNYSRGILFTYAIPFYHFGLRARYAFNDKYSVTGYLVNGWNDVVDNNTGKTYGVSFGWNPTKKLSVTQNYLAGPEMADTNRHWRQLSDTVVTYQATDKLSLMANYDYGRGDHVPDLAHPVYWTGAAGYVRYAFSDRYALATRYEYYNDHDGFTTGLPQHVSEFTGTFERRVAQHLITRLEFRRDFSNQPAFLEGEQPGKAQNTLTGGLVYVFDARELH
jgi:lipoprotein-anchoring transpeptidase ErfK/SrfK